MIPEVLMSAAAAGGTAVVQAAGTDAWSSVLRQRLAGWFGRGDKQKEQEAEQRLETAEAALRAAEGTPEADAERVRQEAYWRARFEVFLENLPPEEREPAAAALRALLDPPEPDQGSGGGTVSGNVFHGPTAVQSGPGGFQVNNFGPRP